MIKVKNLKKSYKKKCVLNSLDFFVEQGEIKALIGINGSGKTTLVESICGIRRFEEGQVLVKDLDVSNVKNKMLLNQIVGFMPQSFCMFNDLTVYENLLYVCSVFNIDKNKIENVLKDCFLLDYKNYLAAKLSGGYKQLLSLATVLIHNPELLILDEPTSAMDPIFRKKFWKIIKDYNKSGSTILLITHYVEELLECHCFSLINKGNIVYDGKVKEFKKQGFINIEEILNKYNMEKQSD